MTDTSDTADRTDTDGGGEVPLVDCVPTVTIRQALNATGEDGMSVREALERGKKLSDWEGRLMNRALGETLVELAEYACLMRPDSAGGRNLRFELRKGDRLVVVNVTVKNENKGKNEDAGETD